MDESDESGGEDFEDVENGRKTLIVEIHLYGVLHGLLDTKVSSTRSRLKKT